MLIKWGSIVVDGSGKLGGHVFSKSRGGATVRTLARANNPQTTDQQIIRSRFTVLSQNWRELTEVQRESWYDAETSYSRTNRFGDVVFLTGKNLYNSINAQRLLIGLPILDLAPLPAVLPGFRLDSILINLSIPNFIIFGNFAIDQTYVVVATQGLSQGVKDTSGRLRIIGVVTNTGGSGQLGSAPVNYDLYVEKFGVPVAGTKVVVGVYSINESGQKSIISRRVATINP